MCYDVSRNVTDIPGQYSNTHPVGVVCVTYNPDGLNLA